MLRRQPNGELKAGEAAEARTWMRQVRVTRTRLLPMEYAILMEHLASTSKLEAVLKRLRLSKVFCNIVVVSSPFRARNERLTGLCQKCQAARSRRLSHAGRGLFSSLWSFATMSTVPSSSEMGSRQIHASAWRKIQFAKRAPSRASHVDVER